MSPSVGVLDEGAVDDLLADDPDEALALVAQLVGTIDEKLRALAIRLAGRLFIDVARQGLAKRAGVGRKLATRRYEPDAGDLDVDASLEAIAEAAGGPVDPEGLRIRAWSRPEAAWCLLVDRSGSMGGRPLATAAVAAAAVATRRPEDHSVLAFAKDVVVVKGQDEAVPPPLVVERLLVLRGHGTTDLAHALTAAQLQLARSPAKRKVAVLLSDCRSTVPGDAVGAARGLDELVVIAPAGDDEDAQAFARAAGARVATVAGPTDVPAALSSVL